MKKLLLMAALAVSSFSVANSYNLVDTTVQNKKAVLEEFTGINCQYCPDGHRIANEIAASNEGQVFPINIHTGGYAVPNSATDPDLQTLQGDTIASKIYTIAGYPMAGISRRVKAAMNRGVWADTVDKILTETAPVNIGVKSSFNASTHELTTEVEYYYTSSSVKTTNYLTVALLQDSIHGYQSNGATYNPDQVDENGLYIHMHAFRMTVNNGSCLGDLIDSTTKGHYGYKKYVKVLPEIIGNIPVDYTNLKVVAFISETKTFKANVINAAEASVSFDATKFVDLGMASRSSITGDGYCVTAVNPKVMVYNTTDSTIKSFDIVATLDGTAYSKSFTGSIAKGDSSIIDWGNIAFSGKGAFSLTFKGFSNINGGTLFDVKSANNSLSLSGIALTKDAFRDITFDFESGSMASDNLAFDNSENDAFGYIYNTTSQYGANSSSGELYFFLLSAANVADKPANLIMGGLNLTNTTDANISYYYAYSDGGVGGSAPHINISVSEDCGSSWTVVNSAELTETGTTLTNGYYYPSSDEYLKNTVSLSDYKGKSVDIKLSVVPGSDGNLVWLDDINIASTVNGVEDTKVADLTIYPNPADLEIRLNNSNVLGANYSIVNLLGEVVANGVNQENRIDISSLSAGCYYLNIGNTTHKFVKK